ncbi:hypothetical protein BB559_002345 [Furculomyces boomerangus]|uniref:Uncharacterized protein n=1 Tax=Furculomyces boomerangus TaxID=61424 RepID=A0A2T9YW58_9FUNG|nr:hypothetical protein BB559_002345 [Furculomyces boomerangus]
MLFAYLLLLSIPPCFSEDKFLRGMISLERRYPNDALLMLSSTHPDITNCDGLPINQCEKFEAEINALVTDNEDFLIATPSPYKYYL